MKSFLAGVCLVAAAGLVSCAMLSAQENVPAGNLVKNPSFEERSGAPKDDERWGWGFLDGVARSPFAHWGYSGFWDGGDYDIKLGKGHSGKACARLVCREKGRGGICTEAMFAAPGTKLALRGFFKATNTRGGPCWVNFEGEPGDGWARIDLPNKPDYDWTEVTGTVTVPTPKKMAGDKVEIYLFIYTQAYGELWMDDVTLTPVEGEAPKAEEKK
jgi:hypothetical protein